MKNRAARAAKLLKAEIKKAWPGIAVSVKSEVYSQGSSVGVIVTDQPIHVVEAIKIMASKYEHGQANSLPHARFVDVVAA